ncbi:rhodanese-like domain-containing protein [Methanoculleus sp. FWC-SCC1]|uniref:Rhodanese-like domain-containing protein n=1 Tax=Methanoculleus frigidifontis TaxID=2584085 RepID=A0ABT8ME36_9EURY|nr:rhodanese-like domain-containing protein [Methanoculleus sp. FWC-SCC1]MDN7026186.1 rhodanese-like domain-containing protein [Methanoculleus sp. FWC-SCC1]
MKMTAGMRLLTVLLLVTLLVLAGGCTELSPGGIGGGEGGEEEGSSEGEEEGGLPVGGEGSDSLSISPGEAYSFLEVNSGNASVVLIDVRTPGEYSAGHLDGAVNIDSVSFADRMGDLDTNATYLLYCQGGVRSADVRSQMTEAGYPAVYDIEGGIAAWEAEDLPVVQE